MFIWPRIAFMTSPKLCFYVKETCLKSVAIINVKSIGIVCVGYSNALK